jgi:hypothetical protein
MILKGSGLVMAASYYTSGYGLAQRGLTKLLGFFRIGFRRSIFVAYRIGFLASYTIHPLEIVSYADVK